MIRSYKISNPVGVRCGILAIILAIAGVFTWVAGGLYLLAIPLSLVFSGISGIFGNTILSTIAVIMTTINSLFIGDIPLHERSFVFLPYIFIPYFFAIIGIITGIRRNRASKPT
jgi:hypothetical protein